jgi:hypothetical protein
VASGTLAVYSMSMGHVLDGIRVLDFGRYIAGPYCAALLADLGADVIRVERVGGGEDRWVTPVTSDGVGSIYLQCNRGKRGLTLDPSARIPCACSSRSLASAIWGGPRHTRSSYAAMRAMYKAGSLLCPKAQGR